ncbi:MAG: TraR/DksA C4-type zinc finger protein [Syntrophales bacterium]|nr:TraR/DksA C4-type zinc finger protein [Syntrophales bacterium]
MREEYRYIYSLLIGHLNILNERCQPAKNKKVATPEKVAEYLEQATLENDCEFELIMRKRVEQQKKEIKEAIKRIEDDDYGTCMKCGREIDLRRLLAKPTSKLCYQCQAQQEKEEKMRKRGSNAESSLIVS